MQGIDVSEIEVTDNGDKIVIEIPDSEVQSVYVDPESIEFHDESFALFNWDSKKMVLMQLLMLKLMQRNMQI